MAQLNTCPTGDQEDAGSPHAHLVGNILSWRLIMKYLIFSTVILSRILIQEGQWSVSGERMCTILNNGLVDKACLIYNVRVVR